MIDSIPRDWPNVDTSVMHRTPGVRWHVQIAEPNRTATRGTDARSDDLGGGQADPDATLAAEPPTVLLLHGTGGSTHEWAEVMPRLRRYARVIAPDLPGHGFSVLETAGMRTGAGNTAPESAERSTAARPTSSNERIHAHVLSLPGMAIAVADLLRSLGRFPVVIAGHSAGAAVALRMTLDGLAAPRALVGFNPALIPPPQIWVDVLAPFAGLLVESSWLSRSAAWLAARGGTVRTLLESSGATVTAEQVERYERLFSDPAHCAAALAMMNRWNLPALARDAVALAVPFQAYAGERDLWVPKRELAEQLARIPGATMATVPGVGHLLPEEAPQLATNAILEALAEGAGA